MTYLSQTLYLWWLAAFALGVAAALFAPRGDEKSGGAWLAGGLTLFALAAMAALAHIVPGRAGLWLDTGVLAVAAYGVGCLVGAALAAPFVIGAGASAPAAKRRLQELLSPAAPACAPPIHEAAAVAAAGAVAQAFLKLMEAPQPGQAEAPAGEAAPASHAQPEHEATEDAGRGRPQPMARPQEEDDLRLIRGVDAALRQKLREIGVWRFSQIAAWGPEQIAWVAEANWREIAGFATRLAGAGAPARRRRAHRPRARRAQGRTAGAGR